MTNQASQGDTRADAFALIHAKLAALRTRLSDLAANAPRCVACGEVHDDGPTASNGDVSCGECAREASR